MSKAGKEQTSATSHASGPSARRRISVRTLPEQIADELGGAIARGEYVSGQRLLELVIAEQFQVSRGPVREALRILVQRGLAEMPPRRGASVTDISLNRLVDLFNIRTSLVGLASRYFASMASDDARERLEESICQVEASACAESSDQAHYTRLVGRVSQILILECGSPTLSTLIEDQAHSSAWAALWSTGRLDFESRKRRLESAGLYREFADVIAARDGTAAEGVMRKMLRVSLDYAVAVLGRARNEGYDPRRLV